MLEFPHSHYCEKARWALDYKGVQFQPVTVLPGFHLITVRRYASGTSVPVLITEEQVVQGSGEIIDFLDKLSPESPLTPADPHDRQMCLDIEKDMEVKLGENLRQILYHRLLDYPGYLQSCFTYGLPCYKKIVFRLIYPVLRSKMYKRYVISPESVEQARYNFKRAMSGLKKLLGRNKYLVGEQFTRADLAVASMLSILVLPHEHPFPWEEIPDPELKTFYDEYRDHPVYIWATELYKEHRLTK